MLCKQAPCSHPPHKYNERRDTEGEGDGERAAKVAAMGHSRSLGRRRSAFQKIERCESNVPACALRKGSNAESGAARTHMPLAILKNKSTSTSVDCSAFFPTCKESTMTRLVRCTMRGRVTHSYA